MTSTRTLRFTCVAVATAALLTACGGEDPAPDAAATAPAASATTTAPAAGGGTGGGGAPIKAEEIEARTALRNLGQELPGGYGPQGAVRWTDAAGEHHLVQSFQEAGGKPVDGAPSTSYRLRADLFTTKGGTTRRVRTVTDGVENCEFDSYTEFHKGLPEVTDADGDGIGEVLFGYSVGCISDVSPVDFKLLALEGADKYILRGETYTSRETAPHAGPLAKTAAEPAFGSWPAGLRTEAEQRWDNWTIWQQ
jgi:hypothetical protein